jgi:hypothetical protein
VKEPTIVNLNRPGFPEAVSFESHRHSCLVQRGVVSASAALSSNHTTPTIKPSYALAEDAERVCALVNAVPDRSVGDCASVAFFNYDRRPYDRLRAIRDDRIGAITQRMSEARG